MLHYEDIAIGWTRSAGGYALAEDEMVDFARRWDPQPWHVDREAAARSPMHGITASSAHSYAIAANLLNRIEPVAGIASLRHEIDLPSPARPGDVLTLTMTCVGRRVSASRPDRGLLTFVMTLTNQAGACVMQMRSLMMVRTRAAPVDAT
ncbi:MAG: MaoC/PaaZ C-terminal domain-containing protein [Burkholderiales bacterium]